MIRGVSCDGDEAGKNHGDDNFIHLLLTLAISVQWIHRGNIQQLKPACKSSRPNISLQMLSLPFSDAGPGTWKLRATLRLRAPDAVEHDPYLFEEKFEITSVCSWPILGSD